ncbi:MAG: hypothetical protein Q8Q24_02230, partial [bacterium]|nr:hypothetical protein [bacterium]
MLEVVKFLLFLLIFVFLPGKFLLSFSKVKTSAAESFFLSGALGIILVTFLSFVLGYLKIGFLVFPLLIGLDLYLIAFQKWRPVFPEFSKKDILPIVVIGLGALFQSILLFKSGTSYHGGLAFWGVNGYDAIWHSALIQELTTHFPPQNPGFAGEALKNYHFLTDLFLAQIHKATGIGILDLYFRFGPAFFTILLNSLIYLFLKRWSGKQSVALWGIFFISIAGSFGWVPPLFGKGSNNWETAFWSIQTPSSFVNPPFGVSLILLTAGLLLFNIYLKQPTFKLALILGLLFGSLIGFKSYAGVIVLGGLAILAAFGLLKGKWHVLTLFVMSFLLSLMFYLPISGGSTNYFVWQPWWFIQTMIEAPDRLNWSSLELRRQVYALHSNWRNIFLLQAFAFFIFLFGNLGVRFFGFLGFGKKIMKEQINQFLLLLMIFAFFPPIFFIQKVVPWNAIQFFYYFIFLF